MPMEAKRNVARIAHLTSAHPALDVRIFHKECRSLARAGYDVIAIGNHECNEIVDGVRFRGLGRSRNRIQRMTVKQLRMCREAFRAAADVYHIHDPDLLAVGILLRAARKRVIYDIHEDLPRTILSSKEYLPKPVRKPLMWIVERAEKAAAQYMSGLITATPGLADRFRTIHSNTVVVSNFVIVDEFAPSTHLDWKKRLSAVTYYGGISEQRGIREMLAAMDLLPRALGAKLELGGWFYEKALQDDLEARPQWRHVNWHGELNRTDVVSVLSRVRVGLLVLHPDKAYVASQPTKLFEYMAAGIPVVASDFPLWRNIIQNAGCGLLVDPFDTHSIAAAIERLMTNDSEAQAMGMRGRKVVEERFNWTNEEQTLLSFYSSLLSQRAVLENKSPRVVTPDCKA